MRISHPSFAPRVAILTLITAVLAGSLLARTPDPNPLVQRLETPLPSHGPAKGYLLITGGIPDYKRFIELAGGKSAHIVVIPTAAVTNPLDVANLPPYCSGNGPFAGLHCSVLHTTDRTEADSEAFVTPLKAATGVWLEGGRHWRLTDAYLGTRTLKELFAVLDRSGVIGGGSAGATVQGSYMVRGSSNPDDNTIMMAPGHEIGFGFFTNVTIDQHVDARGRENDLAPVMKAHPDLLGIGLDQSTSITVHGDTLTANGPDRVSIWDHKDHDGKPYYYLRTGDTLNTVTRVATILPHPPRPEIALPVATLNRYTGVYLLHPGVYNTVTVDGSQLYVQLTGQPKFPAFAESEDHFYLKVVSANLDFVKDSAGKVTSVVLHQNNQDVTMSRLDDAEVKRIADADALAKKHFEDQQPAPGSEAAVRRSIAELQAGKINYDLMSPALADATRKQLPDLQAQIAKLGALKSVDFLGVERNGADTYDVTFEHGETEWRILLTSDGKIGSLRFKPL
jgi:cyanophycinase